MWLPAFQLPMFAKCDALPKGDVFHMFVKGNPFPLFICGIPSIQPVRSLRFLRAAVRSAISALNHGCIMPILSLQLQKKIVLYREAEGLVTEL